MLLYTGLVDISFGYVFGTMFAKIKGKGKVAPVL
jgi:hypothetical protein